MIEPGSWSCQDVDSQAGAWEPGMRGYVDLPEHWRYSSARNYAGLERLIDVVKDW